MYRALKYASVSEAAISISFDDPRLANARLSHS
jgi:hypothetical protein